MTRSLAEFNALRDAEDYFAFFGLDYDPQVVNVNRLHILRKFSQAIKAIAAESDNLSEADLLARYQQELVNAYTVFLSSNAVDEKLFKVFQQAQDDVVLLEDVTVT
jgi:nitrogenase-stabilizing/protective protein